MPFGLESRIIPDAKGGEAQENGTSKALPPHENLAGTHVPHKCNMIYSDVMLEPAACRVWVHLWG